MIAVDLIVALFKVCHSWMDKDYPVSFVSRRRAVIVHLLNGW